MHTTLLEWVVGSSDSAVVDAIRVNEPLMLNIGTATTVGIVAGTRGSTISVRLKRPVCAEIGARVAISRQIGARWRLIGVGELAG